MISTINLYFTTSIHTSPVKPSISHTSLFLVDTVTMTIFRLWGSFDKHFYSFGRIVGQHWRLYFYQRNDWAIQSLQRMAALDPLRTDLLFLDLNNGWQKQSVEENFVANGAEQCCIISQYFWLKLVVGRGKYLVSEFVLHLALGLQQTIRFYS